LLSAAIDGRHGVARDLEELAYRNEMKIYRRHLFEAGFHAHHNGMKKSDIECPACSAGYHRIELTSKRGTPGRYRCLICDQVLEVLDGETSVTHRLTVAPDFGTMRGRHPRRREAEGGPN